MSLINIGSTVALNAIETIGCVLLKRIKGEPLPARRWSLGRYGMAINVASMLFLCPLFVLAFFPLAKPVVASTMNWSSTMFGGITLLATAYY